MTFNRLHRQLYRQHPSVVFLTQENGDLQHKTHKPVLESTQLNSHLPFVKVKLKKLNMQDHPRLGNRKNDKDEEIEGKCE